MRRLGLLWLITCLVAAGQTSSTGDVGDGATVRLNLARTYFAKGDLAHARSEAESLYAANPEDIQAAVLLANCYIKLGRPADAVEVMTPLEAKHASDMEMDYSLAFAH